jgi:tripartite-type tricarboxylate transporter receptor subunit TctC
MSARPAASGEDANQGEDSMALITRRHLVAGMAAVPFAVRAQTLPPTLRIVVPFPAGGSVDAVARQVQAGLQQRLGATVVVENQAGGSGSVGAARVAKAPPDGGTWLFVFDSHAVNPFLQPLPFDSARDLDPVMLIGTAPNVLATHPSRPYKNLGDVVAAAKAKPDAVSYATIGAGSLGHLTMVRLTRQAGVQLAHVPYRGGGPAMNDAIAGHVDLIIGSAALVNPQLEGKALRPLVQFGAARAAAPTLRDVPTAAESGFTGIESSAWWGVFAPAGTPAALVERFNDALRASLRDERAAKTLTEAQQITLLAEGPDAFRRFFDKEMQVWGAVVRDNDIKLGSS